MTVPEQPGPVSDGAAEITRQQQAQDFELPEVGAPKADAQVPFASLPTSPFGIIDEQRPRHREESAPSPKALEDLYASCPQVGRGDWKIRVTRTSPPSFRGCATAGYLGEFFERMSMDEFAQKFGGGRYIVAVMRPVSSATGATQSDYKQVKDVKFRVPGDPTLEGIATTSNEDEVRFDPRNFGMPSEKVEVTRLQIARERERELAEDRRRMEERLQAERDQRGGNNGGQKPSFEALDHYNQTVQRAWGDVKEQNHAQLAFWQQEVERLRATEAAQLEEIRSLRERLMRAETEAANTSRQIETSGMREMRERFDERHNDLRESHSRSIAELKERYEEDRRRVLEETQRKNEQTSEDHRSQVDEITRRYQEERRGYESGQNLERERQREDARHRIDQVERAKEIEVRQLRETQESRLEDLRRASERELTAIREQTAREVASVRESERVQSTLVKEMAGGKIDLAQRDSDRARADAERRVAEMEKRLAEARTHNSDLLQQTHKEPLQALQEAQEMSRLTGMVHPSEVDTGGGEAPPPSSLADQLVGLARGVVEKVPEILEKVAHNRVQNQEQAERARAHLAQQQQFRQQQIQRQQQERRAPTRQLAAAPPAAPSPAAYQDGAGAAPFGAPPQYSPLPIGAASFGAVTPPPLGAHPPMVSSPLQPAVEGLPIQEGAQEPVEQEALPPPAEQEAAAEPHAEGTPDAPTPLDGEAVTLFFTELDSAIAGKTVSPELFADGIVSRIGADATRELLEKFAMSDVVETARQISADSAIVTRHGRRYVRALWAVAASKVGATPAS